MLQHPNSIVTFRSRKSHAGRIWYGFINYGISWHTQLNDAYVIRDQHPIREVELAPGTWESSLAVEVPIFVGSQEDFVFSFDSFGHFEPRVLVIYDSKYVKIHRLKTQTSCIWLFFKTRRPCNEALQLCRSRGTPLVHGMLMAPWHSRSVKAITECSGLTLLWFFWFLSSTFYFWGIWECRVH